MPPSLINSLGLRWKTFGLVVLGDGNERLLDVYEAEITWDGKPKRLLVDEAGAAPLIGMGLLRGFELKMQIRPRGKITIKRLRRK